MITIKIQGAAKDTGRNLAKRISEIVDECGHEAITVKANKMCASKFEDFKEMVACDLPDECDVLIVIGKPYKCLHD